ncbi:MAG: hypothetical protein KC549_01645, partial [Myxococcales bacterium]|nr:hypothetical protein [Myxococcales bacterium]
MRWALFVTLLAAGCDDAPVAPAPMDAGRRLVDLAPPPPPDAGPDAFQPAWDQGPPPVDAAPL